MTPPDPTLPGPVYGHYAEPEHVLADTAVEDSGKITILRQWEYDLRAEQVAEEENMPESHTADRLRRVRDALRALGAEDDPSAAPTRHGA
jgi:hypothetical protein